MPEASLILLLLLLEGGVCAGFSGYVAEEKGRSGFGWGFLGLLFGIFALIAVVGLPVYHEYRIVFKYSPESRLPRGFERAKLYERTYGATCESHARRKFSVQHPKETIEEVISST